jgi:hypothetical protein
MIAAGVATVPGRERSLVQVVRAIWPQVDQLYVYLDGHDKVPLFLHGPGIHVVSSNDLGEKLGDAGKFYAAWAGLLPPATTHFLTIDDDINYPPDYAETLVTECRRWEDKAVVGVHGVTVTEPVRSYYDCRDTRHTFKGFEVGAWVNFVGTGCACFAPARVPLRRHDFPNGFMADIWLGIRCKELGIPSWSVPRPTNWLACYENLSTVESIHAKYKHSDEVQTAAVRAHAPWPVNEVTDG